MNIYQHVSDLENTLNNLKQSIRLWKCEKDLKDEDGTLCFKQGEVYERDEEGNLSLTLIDEQFESHILGPLWEKYFKCENKEYEK